MNKQELIKGLNWLRDACSNEGGFTSGVRIGLALAIREIEKLDEPEKVVIPQFVADWWDGDSVTMYGGESINKKYKLRLISEFHDRGLGDYLSRAEDWLDENVSTFLDLVNGKPYEVEEEQKYYVDLETAAYVAKWNGDNQVRIYTDGVFGSDEFEFHLTEKEIKDYDERFWPFAVEVAE